ncbi:MAG: helix-turn-helix domain-containing protein [Anaerolineales bacterium]|nr:helix-turn-helix domain-containing protein [Anaerolineales bacterium]
MESLAEGRRRARAKPFNPKPLVARIEQLLDESKISMRRSGIDAGLDHQTIRRIKAGDRPDMTYCILLANYFDINPNELLQLADWPTLNAFDIKRASAENLPPEAVDVALDIAKIPDPGTRKEVAKAVRVLLKKYFSK